jgi:DNA-binding transcriptional MerR regulator
MATITFDTHKFIRTLRDAGIPEEQAEAIAAAFSQAHIEAEVATKQDVDDLRRDMRELEQRIVIKLGALMAFSIGLVATLVKLL